MDAHHWNGHPSGCQLIFRFSVRTFSGRTTTMRGASPSGYGAPSDFRTCSSYCDPMPSRRLLPARSRLRSLKREKSSTMRSEMEMISRKIPSSKAWGRSTKSRCGNRLERHSRWAMLPAWWMHDRRKFGRKKRRSTDSPMDVHSSDGHPFHAEGGF